MTQLYRHYSQQGDLLYVGISNNAVGRLSQHKHKAEWFDRIAMVTVQNFPTRRDALIAERNAIKDEDPEFNKQGVNLIVSAANKKKKIFAPFVDGETLVQVVTLLPHFNPCLCDESKSESEDVHNDELAVAGGQYIYCAFNDEVAAFSFFCDQCGDSGVISKMCAFYSASPLEFCRGAKKTIIEESSLAEWDTYDKFFVIQQEAKKIRECDFELSDYLPWWMYDNN